MEPRVRVGRAAELSGRSISTIRRWCDQRLIRFSRINGHRLIDMQSLRDLLEGGDGKRHSHPSSDTRAMARRLRAQMRKETPDYAGK